MNKEVFVIIPTYDPDETIMKGFIDDLCLSFSNIIIVNDGSNKKHNEFFEKFKEQNIILLRHEVNKGKGRAIKTALEYILSNFDDVGAIVVADSDGQHSIKDIINVSKRTLSHQDSYVLGVRNFDEKGVPFRNKFGNKFTRNIFKILFGMNILDTQTGLRSMSKKVAEKLLHTKGERYEYETNTLIDAKKKDIPIEQVLIDTIYINDNKTSHFNPIKDSIRVYKVFYKYILGFLSSYLLDILLFILLINKFFKGVDNYALYSFLIARFISSIYSLLVNKKMIFKKSGNNLIKCLALTIVIMVISSFLVNYIVNVHLCNSLVAKLVIDVMFFIVSYFAQVLFIYKSGIKELTN